MVVTSAQASEALLTIAAISRQRNARLVCVGPAVGDAARAELEGGRLPALAYRYRLEKQAQEGQSFTVETPRQAYTGLETPLRGRYQVENATAAIAALEVLRESGIVWGEKALRVGLRAVHWPARIEVVGDEPTIVVDGAHNADSMEKLMQALRDLFDMHGLIVVLSTFVDKDLAGIARTLADVDVVILTRMASPRAATIEQLLGVFTEHAPGVRLESANNSPRAMELALDIAERGDLVCATGSLYFAAEVLRWSAAHGSKEAAMEIEGVDH